MSRASVTSFFLFAFIWDPMQHSCFRILPSNIFRSCVVSFDFWRIIDFAVVIVCNEILYESENQPPFEPRKCRFYWLYQRRSIASLVILVHWNWVYSWHLGFERLLTWRSINWRCTACCDVFILIGSLFEIELWRAGMSSSTVESKDVSALSKKYLLYTGSCAVWSCSWLG